MKNLKSFRTWVHGLGAAFIGGGATALGSWGGLTLAKAAGMDVPVLNFTAIKTIFVFGALTNVVAYLKQSPLPPIEDEAMPGNPS